MQLVFAFCAVVRCLCPPSSHRGGCRLSGTELQPHPSPSAMDAQPNWKGKCFPVGMWQWREFCSPGAWVRQMPGRKAVRSLRHEVTEGPPQLSQLLKDSLLPHVTSRPHRMPSKTTMYSMEISSPAPKADSFLVGVHRQCHTAAGISGDLLAIPARSPGQVCVRQGCTFCGYFPFEARLREVKLFAWYIFLCGNGQTPFSCFWLPLIEPAKLNIFAMYLPSL